jgi:hypothetical protein
LEPDPRLASALPSLALSILSPELRNRLEVPVDETLESAYAQEDHVVGLGEHDFVVGL